MFDYYISDFKWQKLYSILQSLPGIRVKDESRTRRFVEGIFNLLRTGAQWRELPPKYGRWRSVHKRYDHWCRKEIWSQVLSELSKDYDGESVMIDATIVRAHPCASGYKKDSQKQEALGRSVGGFTTKIHAVVDALGLALRFRLTPGQRHEVTQARSLLAGFRDANILADRGYDSQQLVDYVENQGCVAVIPSRKNRKVQREYDEHLYKERHLVEIFFNKIKHFRRVFSRFEKKAASYMGFLAFASTILWLR